MTLVSFKETYPDYRDTFSQNNLSHLDDYSVYAQGEDKVGSVEDGLFESETGRFRYLIVDTGVWIFGKKVLLPIGKARFDNDDRRVYVNGLTKEQVENLPEYSGEAVDYDYEERVRGVYRENTAAQSAPVEGAATTYNRDTYSYDYDADLYNKPEEEAHNQPIRLYEERLVADKDRFKAGSVTVGKRVEAETAQVSVPVEKERVVIERTEPTGTSAATADHAFEDGEVARVDVYEEKANIRKEAVVREEVNVRKESTEEVVSDQVTVRREELDVDNADHAEVVTK